MTEIILLLYLLQTKEEKKIGGKMAERSLGKSQNFPLPLPLRALTCPIREMFLDVIIETALPAPHAGAHRSCTQREIVCLYKLWFFF